MPRKRSADLAIIAAALLLVAILAALRAAQNPRQRSFPSTYDTGVNGYAALYDLLAREGQRVDRLELPIGELSRGTRTLVIAGDHAFDGATAAPGSRAFLDHWVRRGGKLVVLDGFVSAAGRRALGMPPVRGFARRSRAVAGCAFVPALRDAPIAGTFEAGYAPACSRTRATIVAVNRRAAGIAYRRGRGIVLLFATPSVFDNLHLSQRANARAAYALLSGSVLFDERVHGYAVGRTFWQVLPGPMRIGIGIALAAVLLAIAGANLPFAPAYDARTPEERDSSAYIASLARMLQRGGAAREAIARIAARCEQVLSARSSGDERARMLLREVRTLQSTPRPGAAEVLAAGRIFARVRKDYGC